MADQRSGIEWLSFPCGRILGTQIRLHVLLPLAAVLAALSTILAGHPWQSVVLAVLVAGPLLVITARLVEVLIHELGHVIAAKRCGCTADHILLWPLGGLAFIGGAVKPKDRGMPRQKGIPNMRPMLGLWAGLLALLHGSVTLSSHGLWVDSRYCTPWDALAKNPRCGKDTNFGSLMCIAMLNTNLVMLQLFNLLVPCFPLDCSRILASLLILRGMDPGPAAKIIVICSIVALCGVIALSVWSFLTEHSSSSLNLVLAVWLAAQTWRLHQARVNGQLAYDPLFSAVMDTGTASSTTGDSATATATGRSFQTFQGGGTALGKPSSTPGNSSLYKCAKCSGDTEPAEVCLASVIALLMAMSVSQVGTSPS
eukprot:Skav234123  [mRNA]  locus=scaffold753:60640:65025:- [translate_table: standard]